jgi:hypothetical protein
MASRTADIVDLHAYRTGDSAQQNSTISARANVASERLEPTIETVERTGSKLSTDILDLYPDAGNEVFGIFLCQKLAENASRLRGARDDGPVAMDDAVSHLKADLADVFLQSGMPDGVGAVVISLNYALRNSGCQPLSDLQHRVLLQVLDALARAPSLPFARAIEVVDKLSGAGFRVDPPEVEQIYRMLDADSAD